MHRHICILFFLAISGCSKPHAPAVVQDLHSRAADFRHNVIRPNVMTVIDDLFSKLNSQWQATNQEKYKTAKGKLVDKRDAALILATDKDSTIKVYTDFNTALDTLDSQLATANSINAIKLKDFKQGLVDKLNSQFDRSEQADIDLIHYEMGLSPSTLDRFLVGDPTLIGH